MRVDVHMEHALATRTCRGEMMNQRKALSGIASGLFSVRMRVYLCVREGECACLWRVLKCFCVMSGLVVYGGKDSNKTTSPSPSPKEVATLHRLVPAPTLDTWRRGAGGRHGRGRETSHLKRHPRCAEGRRRLIVLHTTMSPATRQLKHSLLTRPQDIRSQVLPCI